MISEHDSEDKAYNEGALAYADGIDEDECPYANEILAEAWRSGYSDERSIYECGTNDGC